MRRRKAEGNGTSIEAAPPPIVSTLEVGPEVVGLITEFVTGLPERAAALERSLASDDLDGVADLAHRLKGSAAGYGFPSIMSAAANLEASARSGAAIWQVAGCVQAVVALCRRARAPREAPGS